MAKIETAKTETKRHVVTLTREKETKNTIRFNETTEEGKPPVIGQMYLPKWVVGEAAQVTVTVEVG